MLRGYECFIEIERLLTLIFSARNLSHAAALVNENFSLKQLRVREFILIERFNKHLIEPRRNSIVFYKKPV